MAVAPGTPQRLTELTGTGRNVRFGLARLRTDGMWQSREGNSIRDRERSERKAAKEGGDAPSRRPWMIWKPEEQKNRSRWPRCPLSFALAPPEKLPLKHMFQQKKARQQKRARTPGTHADAPISPVILWKGAGFHLKSGDCTLSFSTMLCDIHSMRYLIFPYFNLGIRKEEFLLSQGHQAKAKKKKKGNSQTVNYGGIMHFKIIKIWTQTRCNGILFWILKTIRFHTDFMYQKAFRSSNPTKRREEFPANDSQI